MKKINILMLTGIVFILTGINVFAQDTADANAALIEPSHLSIGFSKTTSLVFPYAIKSVDRGSKDVLAQKARGVENILQVKAGKANFDETNLTVITSDGKLYSYVVNYAGSSAVPNVAYATANANDNKYPDAFFSPAISNEAVIEANAFKVAGKKRTLYAVSDKDWGIKLSLNGLFIQDEVMYYQVKIENNSNINYDIDQLRFFIRDQRKATRTATQELEVKPMYAYGNTTTILNQFEHIIVFALPKFTIPDRKYLAVELMEKEGGRHLSLSLKNKLIMNAKLIF